MGVLIEAVSVVVKIESIEGSLIGGRAEFMGLVPNSTFCADDDLARVGFMDPEDAADFIALLESRGLRFVDRGGMAVDIAVGDQVKGLTTPCRWAEFYRADHFGSGSKVAACRISGSQSFDIALPALWDYNTSLSKQFGYAPLDSQAQVLEFKRRDGDMDVHIDLTSGHEVFVARPLVKRAAQRMPRPAHPGGTKPMVLLEVGIIVLLVTAGAVWREPGFTMGALLVAYVFYLLHAWHLWTLQPSCYPNAGMAVTRLSHRFSGHADEEYIPGWRTVAAEVLSAPFIAAVALYSYLWMAWQCGAVDRFSESVASQPSWLTVVLIVFAGYYWWTAKQRRARHVSP